VGSVLYCRSYVGPEDGLFVGGLVAPLLDGWVVDGDFDGGEDGAVVGTLEVGLKDGWDDG